jgi:hypothetical protein
MMYGICLCCLPQTTTLTGGDEREESSIRSFKFQTNTDRVLRIPSFEEPEREECDACNQDSWLTNQSTRRFVKQKDLALFSSGLLLVADRERARRDTQSSPSMAGSTMVQCLDYDKAQ